MLAQSWPFFLVSYLIGSIPTAYIVSRLVAGRDIRELGDRNMGAKNVFHSVGWLAGAVVAAVDIAKGAAAIWIAQTFQLPDIAVLIAGGCAVLGHDFPLFARFRGGQGMATILGVFGMLFPRETVLALAALAIVLALTRNWDFSCGVAFVLLVGLMWLAGQPPRRLLYPFILLPTIGIRKMLQRWQAGHLPVSGRPA